MAKVSRKSISTEWLCVIFAHPFLPIAHIAMGNCMSKLSVPVIGSLHFLKVSPLIFQLSFKITNCHHETGFSCCLRLSAGFDQFRPHFPLGKGLEIFSVVVVAVGEFILRGDA